ncbi:hypothetical protein BDR05DRAFT_1000744 [Suillus weaverae]|nr:hypothetical protein BDR05DRAFT_1000744 [Suillus weaverae]
MSNMAARNFEDLLQCAIPVFDSLLPHAQNKIVIDLLFIMVHWHGLAKLCMHSNLTLQILDDQTTELGEHLRLFKAKVCSAYNTQELDRELDVRSCRLAKEAVKQAVNGSQQGAAAAGPRAGANLKGKQKASTDQSQDTPGPSPWQSRRNSASDPHLHHHIGQSEKIYDEASHCLHSHAGDPAMKDFLPRLKDHLLEHLNLGTSDSSVEKHTAHSDEDRNLVLFKRNQIYHHHLARFNYTTYDVQQAQDVVNPKTPHCNIMLLHDENGPDDNYCYAKVLGIHHVNVVCTGNVSTITNEDLDSLMGDTHQQHTTAGDLEEEDEGHIAIETMFSEQGQNGSMETLIDALDEMYADHVFDYEN